MWCEQTSRLRSVSRIMRMMHHLSLFNIQWITRINNAIKHTHHAWNGTQPKSIAAVVFLRHAHGCRGRVRWDNFYKYKRWRTNVKRLTEVTSIWRRIGKQNGGRRIWTRWTASVLSKHNLLDMLGPSCSSRLAIIVSTNNTDYF